MPETFENHQLPADKYLVGLGFIAAVKHMRETWAPEKGLSLSNRKAKGLVGAAFDRVNVDYKTIVYADTTGESVAKRWAQFKVNDPMSQAVPA